MIEIGFGTDALYAPHLAATIRSIRDSSGSEGIRVHIAHDGLDVTLRRRIEKAAPGFVYNWLHVPDESIRNLAGKGRFAKSAYYRLALPDLLPHVDRLIYLDCDLVVCQDLAVLWDLPMTQPLAAVADGFADAAAFRDRWSLPHDGSPAYFNTGVLLLDLQALRSNRRFDAALEFLTRNLDDCPYVDQDAINATCWDHIQPIHVAWNVQRNMLIDDAWKPAANPGTPLGRTAYVVHFTTEHKPWLPNTYHPYAWLYWKALGPTDFYPEVVRRSGITPLMQIRLFLRWQRWRLALRPWPPEPATRTTPKRRKALRPA
ncbi:glycosyltransferase family 8 protein [Mongoliimonas terrestris]|uniref:glycosyltransferase family 8 protein n=1 Tax=Mongoliimonas terrestris TaxID=1709001 RepID=UPI0009498400|nr:glycosyltransferase family 8 protein [Mongoliimonas terrestris]